MGVEVFPFSEPDTTVPALTKYTLAEEMNFDGMVTNITLGFPDGCNMNVRIICKINNRQILPSQGYIALNDFTKDWNVKSKVKKGDDLIVVIENRDPANPHTPSITWTLETEEES